MRSFYHYALTFRGGKEADAKSRLADWLFYDHGFPKQSKDYHEISNYLELNSPFPDDLAAFDQLWEAYKLDHPD